MERLRHFACLVAMLLLAIPALAGIGSEQLLRVRTGYPQFSWAVAFDGTHYVILYVEAGQLWVQRVSEDGTIVDDPFGFDDSDNAFNVSVASAADGTSLALWVTTQFGFSAPVLHAAVIPPRGAPRPSFTIGRNPSIWAPPPALAVGDSFLIAWADNDGTYVSRTDRLTSSNTSSKKIADGGGYPKQLATAGSNVVLLWNNVLWPPCPIPEGCPYPVPYIGSFTPDGEAISGLEVWPQQTSEALDPAADDLLIVQPDTVLRHTAGVWQRWRIPNVISLAKAAAGLHASVVRGIAVPEEQYVGPVDRNGHLAHEYRFPAPYAYLFAGRTSMLALYESPNGLAYRPIDLTTPFPPLPLGPATISATLALSPKPYPNPWFQVNVQWTPALDAVDRYIVEAEPLSDPTARFYITSVDSSATTAVFDQLQADVEYAFRVYGSTPDGLSPAAEAVLRSPADLTVRPPVDVTIAVDGTTATFRWRDVSSNETGFRIRAFGIFGGIVTVAELPADTTTATVRLLPGTYMYKLSAFNATNAGDIYPGYWLSTPVRIRATHH